MAGNEEQIPENTQKKANEVVEYAWILQQVDLAMSALLEIKLSVAKLHKDCHKRG